jgi:hypothetical protein
VKTPLCAELSYCLANVFDLRFNTIAITLNFMALNISHTGRT